ncbi:hypothetical protein MIH18_15105 [Marinobacter sp. M3C]|uniref:hypothetical protein n=1 Tax=unclassified Marinobacter TaxID=83889 RepID=UPI00200BCA13|nr:MULTISPECIES: hypothetical protein [unclassified Marinobacter]MCL1478226.1 hypothetical protein [Marinobacter sp.]MCL1480184.1 hypothetical protein [Marinobacter sp.]UQG55620.1 hypothetical protein MIH16_19870 [Marinobacter sp. M4C]UQG59074.1 hypothetical protein MIH18_15105 [Marinobacter sp. M3C]UQG64424.1 hypothetical protein MIH17_19865 [Marinobacter sp. M2C]
MTLNLRILRPAAIRLALVMVPVLSVAQAQAADWSPVLSDAELAQKRGGFFLNRFEIAIGLEQRVSVNGDLQVINSWRIPNISDVGSYAQALKNLPVLRDVSSAGDGARVTSGVLDNGSWMTLIQNNVDGAVIQNMQQLNIELNNLGQTWRLPPNFQDSMLSLPRR